MLTSWLLVNAIDREDSELGTILRRHKRSFQVSGDWSLWSSRSTGRNSAHESSAFIGQSRKHESCFLQDKYESHSWNKESYFRFARKKPTIISQRCKTEREVCTVRITAQRRLDGARWLRGELRRGEAPRSLIEYLWSSTKLSQDFLQDSTSIRK